MIASGKSTYAKTRAREGAIVMNDDAIYKMVHAGDYGLYDKKLKPLYKGVDNYLIHSAALLGKDVVIDRPCYKRDTRVRYIQVAKSLGYDEISGIMFPVFEPEIHARKRFMKDNRGQDFAYWLEAAERHQALYEKPSLEEGFTGLNDYAWRQDEHI
jgi:predicted kinase